MAGHNNWRAREKATHLLAVLQVQAADVVHSVPEEATYEDIIRVSTGATKQPRNTALN
jgi:hypothetical protein